VIAFTALLSTAAAAWLRLAIGPSSPFVPWVGLAWTVLFARHSRRATFAGPALVLGAIDGVSAPALWTIWPLAYLAAGILLFSTRRVLPVRGGLGEVALGTLAVVVVRALAHPFPALDLPRAVGPVVPAATGAFLTGVALAFLVALAERWSPLRMRLARVS
jgi:hypothetical protein